jgi:phospholipase C
MLGALCSGHGGFEMTVTVESDASFRRQLAGHVENGRPSMSDPAIGG